MKDSNKILLHLLDNSFVELSVNHMINAGYAGRDSKTVRAHIDELAAIGVRVPNRIPTFYSVPSLQLTTQNNIQVCHGMTSAEVEYVFIIMEGKAYITIGSDHSDRYTVERLPDSIE